MGALPGRLGSLLAQDIMTRDIIVVPASVTVREAIETLREHRITGAPVINDDDHLVGIISVNDLIRSPTVDASQPDQPQPLAHGEDQTTWDLFDKATNIDENTGTVAVSDRMSTHVTSVTETAPLVEIARCMCDGHWHRVPVLDEVGTLVGIISSIDVLAAVVNAADEIDQA